jgi:hypothetical protein
MTAVLSSNPERITHTSPVVETRGLWGSVSTLGSRRHSSKNPESGCVINAFANDHAGSFGPDF